MVSPLAVVEGVPDPEMPFITLGDLGVVRSVRVTPEGVRVVLTPTFTGCPATEVIAADVRRELIAAGYAVAAIELALAPPWSTDWITPAGRTKLQAAGIAQPACVAGSLEVAISAPVPCPRCGSLRTRRLSEFGATPCRASHVCGACREPFEAIKPL